MSVPIESIKQFIIDECIYGDDGDEIEYDLNLIELKIINSLSVLKIINYIQLKTDIAIELDEIDFDNFSSIRSIYEFIKNKIE